MFETIIHVPVEADCPVIQQAETVLSSAKNLRAAINKLRQDLSACNNCQSSGECVPLQELNRQIDQAIETLAKDWGLS